MIGILFVLYFMEQLIYRHKVTNRNLTWFKQLTVQTNRKRESKFRCVGKYHLPYFIRTEFMTYDLPI